MDECTRTHACMATSKKRSHARHDGGPDREHHIESFFSPAFDPRACVVPARICHTHRKTPSRPSYPRHGSSTPSGTSRCATGVLCCLRRRSSKASTRVGGSTLGNRGMRRRRFFAENALCSLPCCMTQVHFSRSTCVIQGLCW